MATKFKPRTREEYIATVSPRFEDERLDEIAAFEPAQPQIGAFEEGSAIEQPVIEREEVGAYGLGALAESYTEAYKELAVHQQLIELSNEQQFPVDPSYAPDDKTIDALTADIPIEYHNQIVAAGSMEEAVNTRTKVQEELASLEEIMKHGGGTGVVAMIGTSFTDPVMMAPNLGIARLMNSARIASKAVKAAQTAALTTTAAGAELIPQAMAKETISKTDVMVGMGLAAGLGASIGSIMGKRADELQEAFNTKVFDEADEAAAVDELADVYGVGSDRNLWGQVDEAGEIIAPSKLAPEPEVTPGVTIGQDDTPLTHRMNIPQRDNMHGLTQDVIDQHLGVTGRTSDKNVAMLAEALRREAAGEIASADSFQKSWLHKLIGKNPLMSDAVFMLQSKSPIARMIATDLLEDATGMGGRLTNRTAAVTKLMNERKLLDMYVPVMEDSYKLWAKENGITLVQKMARGDGEIEFSRQVRMSLEMRRTADEMGTEYVPTHSKAIEDAADSIDAMTASSRKMLKQAGVRGADELKEGRGYAPLIWDGTAMHAAEKAGRLPRFQALLRRGYEAVGIKADDAERISNAIRGRAMAKGAMIDTNPANLFSEDSRLFLEGILSDSGMSAGDIKSMMKRIDGNKAHAGKTGALKSRVSIDLTQSDGDMSLLDFVDNNLPTVLSRHAQEMSGRAALARKGITDDTAWGAMQDAVMTSVTRMDGTKEAAKMHKVMTALQQEFTAQPVGGGINRGIRRLMEFSTLARLGQVGFAQFVESNNLVAAHGLAAVAEYMPQGKKIESAFRKAMKTGKFDDETVELLEEFRVFHGRAWDEHAIHRPGIRIEDKMDVDDATWFTPVAGALDRVGAVASDRLGYASLMYQVKGMQQRAAVVLQSQMVVDMLKKGPVDSIHPDVLRRFNDMGWSAKQLKVFQKNLKHIEFQEGSRYIKRMNFEKWSKGASEEYGAGIHRHTQQVVQLPMVGENRHWQNNPAMALLTQFRTFTITAMEKQAARHLKQLDATTFKAMTYGSALSYFTVQAKRYANTIGMSENDRAEYLSGTEQYSSMLGDAVAYNSQWGYVPEVANIIGSAGFQIPGMPPARRGVGGSWERQVPAIGMLTGLVQGASIPLRATDEDFDQAKARKDAVSTLPYSNTLYGVFTRNVMGNLFD